ncbi:MAG TPA: hypothetical protein VGF62_09215, partial [Rhizomicrobium sp.]
MGETSPARLAVWLGFGLVKNLFTTSAIRTLGMAKTPDLFESAGPSSKGYTAKDIEVLEGL